MSTARSWTSAAARARRLGPSCARRARRGSTRWSSGSTGKPRTSAATGRPTAPIARSVARRWTRRSVTSASTAIPASSRLYFDAFPAFPRFPDIDEVLDRLARRFRLAVVSNIDDDLPAVTDLGRRFDLVCTAERARGYKPDGTLFRCLLERGGVETMRLLHCGQSQRTDMVGAKPLGITVAWINRRRLPLAADVPKPDHEFRDLRPLLELLPERPD